MILEVLLHGERVGVLDEAPSTGVIAFTLDDGYFTARRRPILGQMFEDRRQTQRFRQRDRPGDLPAYFENLMPEGALREVVRSQARGESVIALLARLGSDLPGAVVVRELRDEPASPDAREVFDEAPSTPHAHAPWRFSLAGVQLKMSASRDPNARFTLPFARGDGRWILKFASPSLPSLPENEFAVMRWAARAGLEVPACELVRSSALEGLDPRLAALGERVFAIERYDRGEDGARVHQEDFAQVNGLHPDAKYDHATYEGLARVIGSLCGVDDLLEYVRRLVFMALSGNVDAHRKNWSLIYPDRFNARLSPAYDLVFVLMYPTIERTLALKLAGERSLAAITWDHFARIERFLRARGLDAPIVDEARAFCARAVACLPDHDAGIEPTLSTALASHVASLQITRG